MGALLGVPVMGAGLFGARAARGAGSVLGGKQYRVAHDWPGQFDLVHAIAIDREQRVYVGDRNNDRVQIFDLQGKYLAQWNHVGTPYGLYACDDGTVFLCGLETDGDRFRVLRLSGEGEVRAEFGETGEGPGQFLMAHSIYVDRDGAVFVADGKANRVQKFTVS